MAYRKDDIPKVKLDSPKIDLSGVDFAMKNMNDIFDNIVKDIRERQDNAMAMEFTKCIGELLRKNGVIPKITEYTRENVKESSIEKLYGVSIDELDFSEHDKVFEDKIAKLEKENKSLNSYLVQREQDSTDMIAEQENEISMLKLLIDNYRDAESKLFDENKELKQHIAELESKESVKPMRIEFHADNGEMLTPLEVANSLINQNILKVDELRELAEHLQVYCRHHNDKEVETISF